MTHKKTTTTSETAKRDTETTCTVCHKTFRQDGIGRMRHYCSDACKQEAYRQRRKPPVTTEAAVNSHYLEQEIGRYMSEDEFMAAEALRKLAEAHKIAIREDRVTHWYEYHEQGRRSLAALLQF